MKELFTTAKCQYQVDPLFPAKVCFPQFGKVLVLHAREKVSIIGIVFVVIHICGPIALQERLSVSVYCSTGGIASRLPASGRMSSIAHQKKVSIIPRVFVVKHHACIARIQAEVWYCVPENIFLQFKQYQWYCTSLVLHGSRRRSSTHSTQYQHSYERYL